ncbi:MAG: SDR family NAD(P)-dependent oxidoreductase [Bacteroidetes bacterium]|nr:SDR family NAD(P)-dependent oxidoreductase [Bacteroidota bacterium]
MKNHNNMSKKQPTVLLTGAAGGLGQAITGFFSARGCTVIATDLESQLHNSSTTGENIHYFPVDVTDGSSLKSLKNTLEKEGLQPDVVINNAGIYTMFPLSESDLRALQKIFEVNTFGAVQVIRTFLPILVERHGRVINISSDSVRIPWLFQPYQSSKIALEALSRAMRQELRLRKVKLIIIRPGAMQTPLLNWMDKSPELPSGSFFHKEFKAFYEKACKSVGKTIPPEKAASVIYRAATTPHPKRYYRINNNPLLRMASWLPEKIQDGLALRVING